MVIILSAAQLVHDKVAVSAGPNAHDIDGISGITGPGYEYSVSSTTDTE